MMEEVEEAFESLKQKKESFMLPRYVVSQIPWIPFRFSS